MHIRTILLALLLGAGTLGAHAQLTVRQLFTQMPDSLLPQLTENNRLDMLDFMDSGMEARVENALGGSSQLQQLTDVFMQLQLSPAHSVQMLLLEPQDTARALLCVVSTYGLEEQGRQSHVSFYNAKWQPQPASRHLSLPPVWATIRLTPQGQLLLAPSKPFAAVSSSEEGDMLQKELKWTDGIFK